MSMQKKYSLLLLVSFLFLHCSQKITIPLTAEVNVVNEVRNKTIEVRSIGYGNTNSEAMYDSERKAFDVLFFRGLPDTGVEKPLIGSNEAQLLLEHRSYFNNFFNNRYKSFIMSLNQTAPFQKNKGVVSVVMDIKINLISLKRDLEDQGIIRKFGL